LTYDECAVEVSALLGVQYMIAKMVNQVLRLGDQT